MLRNAVKHVNVNVNVVVVVVVVEKDKKREKSWRTGIGKLSQLSHPLTLQYE